MTWLMYLSTVGVINTITQLCMALALLIKMTIDESIVHVTWLPMYMYTSLSLYMYIYFSLSLFTSSVHLASITLHSYMMFRLWLCWLVFFRCINSKS